MHVNQSLTCYKPPEEDMGTYVSGETLVWLWFPPNYLKEIRTWSISFPPGALCFWRNRGNSICSAGAVRGWCGACSSVIVLYWFRTVFIMECIREENMWKCLYRKLQKQKSLDFENERYLRFWLPSLTREWEVNQK